MKTILFILLLCSCTKPDDCGCGVLSDRRDPADSITAINYWLWTYTDECSGRTQDVYECRLTAIPWQDGQRLCELTNLDY
jgi:hypothetical protein